MNKGDEVHISYGPVTIADISARLMTASLITVPSASVFQVSTRTSGDSGSIPLVDGNVTGGRTQAEEGSGTVTLSPDVVDAGETNRTFTLTYKADTEITGDLVITVDGIDPDDPSTEITADTILAETNLTLSLRHQAITLMFPVRIAI